MEGFEKRRIVEEKIRKGCFGNENRRYEKKKSRDVVMSVVANPKRDSLVEGDKQKGFCRATRDG